MTGTRIHNNASTDEGSHAKEGAVGSWKSCRRGLIRIETAEQINMKSGVGRQFLKLVGRFGTKSFLCASQFFRPRISLKGYQGNSRILKQVLL